MEYIYAALLLHRLNKAITEESLKNVIKAAGATPNEVKIKALVAALNEVNIDEVLKTTVATPVVTQPTPTVAPAEAPKKEEKEEEKKEEEALVGLSSLFG
ncbi:MAG: 50S ribosomal protein P1 [Nitrososphaerota archaeon]|nr:50S ribosomal protein P1 [Nitrososphaerales archaeon]MDW8045486.1 50S ribosomal protein P1 [Nitrososphaerota archaeon]